MRNKIRSTIGGLTMLASAALAVPAVTNVPAFTSIGFLPTNNTYVVELRGNIYLGDTNSYKVQSCSNLVGAAWQDSAINTNLFNHRPTKRDESFVVAEPYISNKMNYRLLRK